MATDNSARLDAQRRATERKKEAEAMKREMLESLMEDHPVIHSARADRARSLIQQSAEQRPKSDVAAVQGQADSYMLNQSEKRDAKQQKRNQTMQARKPEKDAAKKLKEEKREKEKKEEQEREVKALAELEQARDDRFARNNKAPPEEKKKRGPKKRSRKNKLWSFTPPSQPLAHPFRWKPAEGYDVWWSTLVKRSFYVPDLSTTEKRLLADLRARIELGTYRSWEDSRYRLDATRPRLDPMYQVNEENWRFYYLAFLRLAFDYRVQTENKWEKRVVGAGLMGVGKVENVEPVIRGLLRDFDVNKKDAKEFLAKYNIPNPDSRGATFDNKSGEAQAAIRVRYWGRLFTEAINEDLEKYAREWAETRPRQAKAPPTMGVDDEEDEPHPVEEPAAQTNEDIRALLDRAAAREAKQKEAQTKPKTEAGKPAAAAPVAAPAAAKESGPISITALRQEAQTDAKEHAKAAKRVEPKPSLPRTNMRDIQRGQQFAGALGARISTRAAPNGPRVQDFSERKKKP